MRQPRRVLPPALGLLLGVAGGAAAARAAEPPLAARYEVRAAGLTVMRVDALLDLDGAAYRVVTRVRTTGLAGLFSSSEQVTSAEGRWQGDRPLPRHYRAGGTWRGARREVALDYDAAGAPVLRALEPSEAGEREPVPEPLRRGTTDTLTALARLARAVERTGRCEGEAATYDGRRRLDIIARTEGADLLPPQAAFPGGEALRCVLESRLVAGRRLEDDPAEAHRPQRAVAWIARVGPGGAMVPVRIEAPSRWFGTLRIELVASGEAAAGAVVGKQALQQRR
jgi:Protein of unknown function (DUF3108)